MACHTGAAVENYVYLPAFIAVKFCYSIAQDEPDALFPKMFMEEICHLGIRRRKNLATEFNQGYFPFQISQALRHFQSDKAAAYY